MSIAGKSVLLTRRPDGAPDTRLMARLAFEE
jgi:hypothetical protein